MGEVKSRKFSYKTTVKWKEQKRGVLSSEGKPCFEISTPVEFHGHVGVWTPEDLFVSSVNICIMTTFLFYAEKEAIELLDYNSDAEGVLERIEGKFMFSQITVRVGIILKGKQQINKAQELIVRAEENCLISNSIATKVIVEPVISAGE